MKSYKLHLPAAMRSAFQLPGFLLLCVLFLAGGNAARGALPPREPEEREIVALLQKKNCEMNFNMRGRVEGVTIRWESNVAALDELLIQIAKLPDVAGLGLNECNASKDVLTRLGSMRNLTRLSLSRSQLGTGSLAVVGSLTKLRVLRLDQTAVDDDGLKQLVKLDGLEMLGLPQTAIDDEALATVSKFTRLKTLDIGGTKVSNRGLRYLEPLTALERLDLPVGINDEGLSHLQNMHNLVYLQITNSGSFRDITDNGLRCLAGMSRLSRLSLSGSKISDEGLKYLSGLKLLGHLDISHTAIGDAGLREISALDQIDSLDIRETKVSDEGLRCLPSISDLHELWVGPGVGEKGMAFIAKIPKLRSLDADVSGNEALSHLKEIRNLDQLSIGGDFTDPALAFIPTDPRLKFVVIAGTKITDDAVPYLLKLRSLTGLRVYGTLITKAGYERLRAMPTTNVIWQPILEEPLEPARQDDFPAKKQPKQ